MLINHILLGGLGLMFGFAAAGGTFALIVAISVVPRIIGMSRTAAHVLFYESMVMLGGVLGNIVTVFPQLPIPFGRPMLALFGLGSGIQVGCLVMALAEIMNVFPIVFRRLKLKRGLSLVITVLAAGKVIGGLFYFFRQMG
ncbi:MAG: stage V sporulation protein AB [Eubacterium sp.]|jgi:stage V sporulation protein AB|nr:stage V sporulation protein AB [Eubacterium sp.]NBI85122.1 stage V sporulation protein AB [Lachnospiraceae bacterium]